MLLTFTRIGKDVFPKAVGPILNVSTAMGTDLNSAALQVGKALNDPAKGINALSRAGNRVICASEFGECSPRYRHAIGRASLGKGAGLDVLTGHPLRMLT